MTGSSTVRVAIVGAGAIADYHARAYTTLAPRFRLTAVFDTDLPKARAFAKTHGVRRVCNTLQDIVELEDIELVDLCTPPFLHVRQAAEALAGGRHVLCEKPISGSLRDIDRLGELERRVQRRLFPIFQYRFDLHVRKTLALKDAGLLGNHRLSTVENFWFRGDSYFRPSGRGSWRYDLGGTLASHAIHAHDILCAVVGMPKRVFARAASIREGIETEDLAAATFVFGDGSLATSAANLSSKLEQTRFCFVFERVSVEGIVDMTRWEQPPWRFVPADPSDQDAIADTVAAVDTKREQFEAQFAALHDCLAHGHPAPVTLKDARRSVELLTAMYYSADHATEVELPLGVDHAYYDGWRAEPENVGGGTRDG